ncbi:hypothetical protein AVP43_01147 [Geobacillus stearothermophilus]|nr:hypothetical protein GARCT_00342 [Geobacillus sp. 12AMOR1]EQB94362.1 hypothetical protein GA8_17405 [Geobacillus sp. A8]KZE96892.1 hypothetical protein AVP43_01147 [Geobacillus stearothermophilus]STO36690.1 Uncharacterised protein [[Flavobacterium] thermophilum]
MDVQIFLIDNPEHMYYNGCNGRKRGNHDDE